MSYLSFQQFYRERLAALDDRIVSQERLLTDYQTKLRGATPEEAATQIEKLTSLLADTQKSLNEIKIKAASVVSNRVPQVDRRRSSAARDTGNSSGSRRVAGR